MTDRITVNEQSSIRIAGEKVLRFDPFRIPDAPHDADVIFITHAHYDHFSADDIAKTASPDTVFVFPASMQAEIDGLGIPAERQVPMTAGEEKTVCGVPVTAVPAYNRLKPFHPKGKGWLGYLVTAENTKIYVAGDTDATQEAKKVRCDIAILPIGGTYTMDAPAAAALADCIRPACVIPTHYGTVVGKAEDFRTFSEKLKNTAAVEKLFLS